MMNLGSILSTWSELFCLAWSCMALSVATPAGYVRARARLPCVAEEGHVVAYCRVD